VNGANIVMTDIICSNGVIHVIDAVLTPHADVVDITEESTVEIGEEAIA